MIMTAALNGLNNNKSDAGFIANFLPSIISLIERVSPERAALLERRLAEHETATKALRDMRFYRMLRYGTTEALLDAAEKSSDNWTRGMLYEQAAWKALAQGDDARARQIVSDKVQDSERRNLLLEQIERRNLWRAVTQGKVEEARQRLARIKSKDERALALSHLAFTLALKGEKKIALQLLDEARALAAPKPRNEMQLNATMQIVRAYAVAEPARSFEMIEILVDQSNELIAAAATLNGFVGRGGAFKKGELVLPQGYAYGVERYQQHGKQLAALALFNFERTKAAADRFRRQEVRLMARLFIAQGVLAERLGPGLSSGAGVLHAVN
jgi:hypothetical protein